MAAMSFYSIYKSGFKSQDMPTPFYTILHGVLSTSQSRLEISKLKAKMYQHMWVTWAFYANAYVWLITYKLSRSTTIMKSEAGRYVFTYTCVFQMVHFFQAEN